MAKKQQTTGLPNKKRRETSEHASGYSPLTNRLIGEFDSAAERDQRIQRLIIWGSIGIVAILAIILGAAFLYDRAIVPSQVVATVNGEDITVGEFQTRVRFERSRLEQQLNNVIAQFNGVEGIDVNQILGQEPYATWLNEVQFPDQLGLRVLNDIIDDTLVSQEADALGISIGEETLQSEINDYFGYDPTQVALIGAEPTATPEPTVTPTPFVSPTPTTEPTASPDDEDESDATEESPDESDESDDETLSSIPTLAPSPTDSPDDVTDSFNNNVDAFRSVNGGEQSDDFFNRLAVRNAVKDSISGEVSTIPYVNARHILVDTEEEALDIISALNSGELFADFARAVSLDTGSGSRGGELGWSPSSNYVEEFAEAVDALPVGEISEPVQTQFGYHVIQVLAREEREASDLEIDRVKDLAFENWLEELRDSEETEISISDIWVNNVPR